MRSNHRLAGLRRVRWWPGVLVALDCIGAAACGAEAAPSLGLRGAGVRAGSAGRVVEPSYEVYDVGRRRAAPVLAVTLRNPTRDTLALAPAPCGTAAINVVPELRTADWSGGGDQWEPVGAPEFCAPKADEPRPDAPGTPLRVPPPFLLGPGAVEHIGVRLAAATPGAYRLTVGATRWCSRGPDRWSDRVPCPGGDAVPVTVLRSRVFWLR
jgi:hypothetical protein